MLILAESIVLSMIVGIVTMSVGWYFRKNYYQEIGKNGIWFAANREDEVKWLYAQSVAPGVLVKMGAASLAVTILSEIAMVLFGFPVGNFIYYGNIVGVAFLAIGIFKIEDMVEKFNPCWMDQENATEEKARWINFVKTCMSRRDYKTLENLAK